MSDETMLSAKEVAAKLKMDPKRFRALLRKINGKSNKGARYEWKARGSRAVSPTVNSMWAFWWSNAL